MPGEVSDLRDVVDAINRLCDTMKTSYDSDVPCDEENTNANESLESELGNRFASESFASSFTSEDVASREDVSVSSWDNTVSGTDTTVCEDVAVFHEAESVPCEEVSVFHEVFAKCKPQRNLIVREDVISLRDELMPTDLRHDRLLEASLQELVSPEGSFRTIEVINREQNWSDSLVSLPAESVCEPASEMYYTASSEVSLLSDTEAPPCAEKAGDDCVDGKETADERKDCVIAGHVAAMRERFESMTRTNTPCPDSMMRSMSPSHDVFRNITPSPDRLG